ncbi:hypothetical protein J4557_40760 [Actinomadura nitritigenes]|uniref:Thymidylate kinase-like domain-containing protein n=2 Tax=Actinomadura nitritigenes TaxID=134602 RepID=A0ABS3RCD1_9ACTN|nr:hypothetical protein [Actinomadura nitritigenes]
MEGVRICASHGARGAVSRAAGGRCSIAGWHMAVALAVAAERPAHVAGEIEPALAAGKVVISDRYLPSLLVLQRLDGLPLAEIWSYNAFAPRPFLTVCWRRIPRSSRCG